LYRILIDFGIPMNVARLITLFLQDLYSRVQVGKHLSDIFPTKNSMK